MSTRLVIGRSRLYRWLDIYEDFVGIKEVKQAQNTVNDAEREFIKSQNQRRLFSDELIKLQTELVRVRFEMDKLSRSDDAYFDLFKTEHDLVKKEKNAQLELKRQDDDERKLFSSLQIALRESQEKEKMRIERTKYWSIIGSIVGALAGIIGTTLSNRHRMKEFRNITNETQKLYENLINRQENSINQLKIELSNLPNEENEKSTESNNFNQTVFTLLSASFLSIIISYYFNR